jgi:phosphoribosyl 1,2-cyclic phosphodiesterase
MMTRVMSPPNFPIKYTDIKAEITYEDGCPDGFKIDTIKIEPINLSHPNSGCGYKFSENEKTFVFLTDNELGHIHENGKTLKDYAEFSKNCDLLIHDCEYSDKDYLKRKEWGHSSVSQVAELAKISNVKKLGLFHHNQDKTDKDVDNIVKSVKNLLKDSDTQVFGVCADMEINL